MRKLIFPFAPIIYVVGDKYRAQWWYDGTLCSVEGDKLTTVLGELLMFFARKERA